MWKISLDMFCIVIVNKFREKTKTNDVVVCHQIQKRSLTPSETESHPFWCAPRDLILEWFVQ